MMESERLVDTSNMVMVSVAETMTEKVLNILLIWTEMGEAFRGDTQSLVNQMGLTIEGTDVVSVAASYATEMKKVGAVHRLDIKSATESEIIVDISECIFGPATTSIRNDDHKMIPPCPAIAILFAAIRELTGKNCTVTKCEFHPDLNTCTYTVALE